VTGLVIRHGYSKVFQLQASEEIRVVEDLHVRAEPLDVPGIYRRQQVICVRIHRYDAGGPQPPQIIRERAGVAGELRVVAQLVQEGAGIGLPGVVGEFYPGRAEE